ncbi:MAG TPA: hypothetical protein VF624_04275 [Tepidisphaeraceae bacterium]
MLSATTTVYDSSGAVNGAAATSSHGSVSGSGNGIRRVYGSGVNASPVISNTHTVALSSLPEHTMLRVTIDFSYLTSMNIGDDDTDTAVIAFGNSTQTLSLARHPDYPQYVIPTYSSNFGKWVQHDGSSLSITVSTPDAEPYEGYFDFAVFVVEAYQPEVSVSVSGNGTTSEDSTTPTTFTVSRELPSGYVSTSNGDAAVPDTTVSLTRGGTATSGTDYTSDLPTPSATPTPTLTMELENGAESRMFSVTPILDDNVLDEEDEAITLGIQSGNDYGVSSTSGSAAITLAASAKFRVNANSTKSIYGNTTGSDLTIAIQLLKGAGEVKIIHIINGQETEVTFNLNATGGGGGDGCIFTGKIKEIRVVANSDIEGTLTKE